MKKNYWKPIKATLLPFYRFLLPNLCSLCDRRHTNGPLCWSCKPPAPIQQAPEHQSRCFYCYSRLSTTLAEKSTPLHYPALCPPCLSFPSPIKFSRYAWDLSAGVHQLIKVMKYKPSFSVVRTLAELSCGVLFTFPQSDWDLIVPIPSSKASFSKRLFNQAQIIGSQLAQHLPHSQLECRALVHLGYKSPQAALAHKYRLSNVHQAFEASSNMVENKKILLIDDLVTTGATTGVAAKALDNAGAARVDLFSLARSRSYTEFRSQVSTYLYPT